MEKESYQNTRRTGAVYERKAGAYLEKYGYKILEYNYRCRQGEVDIVASCLLYTSPPEDNVVNIYDTGMNFMKWGNTLFEK